jgi:hypothetical protein
MEFNNDFQFREKEYDGWEDIVPKIKYFQYSRSPVDVRLSALENINFGNRSLVFNYANDLFDTYIRKRGLLILYQKAFFKTKWMIDNIIDWDILAGNFDFDFDPWETGITLFYDTDTQNPPTEKPEDGSGSQRAYFDANMNYVISLKTLEIKILFDFAKEFSGEAQSDNFRIATGPQIEWQPVRFSSRIQYSQNVDSLGIFVNHFYELERSNTVIDKKSGLGYILLLELFFTNFLTMELGFEQAEKSPVSFSAQIGTGKKFYTGFQTSIAIYNRKIDKWYRMLEETGQDTHLKMEFALPLSKNLDLGFTYIKSFHFRNDKISPLRISMLKSSFHF